MSRDDPIDLTGDSDGEAEQMEVGGASSVFFVCFYVRIVYLRKRERAGSVPSYFFQRNSLLLPLGLVTSRPNASAKSARKRRRKYGDVARD